MPAPLSVDLRERVVAAVAAGASCHGAAARFGVSVSSASRWAGRHRQDGQIAAKPSGGDHASHRIEAHADLILSLYEARPEIFLHELRDALAERGVATSTSGLWRFFRRHQITRKRGGPSRRAGAARREGSARGWFADQDTLDPDALVFLDETAANTRMARRYGRAPRGQRCRMAVPHGHHLTTTVTAALRTTGPTAIALFDGATNGARFRAYVTEILAPVLKPGDTVILDNLNVHKVAGVREAIEAAGARILYLPAYSPEFNPIEQIFAKLKALLRTAAARTVPDLREAIRQAFARFTPAECRNCLAAAGYENDLTVAT